MQRYETLLSELKSRKSLVPPWGWKEPNTHVFLPQVLKYYPLLKYIHVIRHGCDMAFSYNQNQLETWRSHFISTEVKNPRNSLKLWVKANQRILQLAESHADSILFVRFEDFCVSPESEARKICRFIGVGVSEEKIREFSAGVRPPDSTGRFREFELSGFDKEDLNALPEFEYEAT